ncbi:hypothetical protein WICPIJ_008402 [Wickerhamomyces pijperi]|uniref:Uncharacterized protein n=1 Tax=Wickerhamomyces pijperi TaxID=599730 RepID=A0A9P8PYS6_WICPI|nr:hypothetical protein WICPIJ_008402 [Wickerhamomyces pijperi]
MDQCKRLRGVTLRSLDADGVRSQDCNNTTADPEIRHPTVIRDKVANGRCFTLAWTVPLNKMIECSGINCLKTTRNDTKRDKLPSIGILKNSNPKVKFNTMTLNTVSKFVIEQTIQMNLNNSTEDHDLSINLPLMIKRPKLKQNLQNEVSMKIEVIKVQGWDRVLMYHNNNEVKVNANNRNFVVGGGFNFCKLNLEKIEAEFILLLSDLKYLNKLVFLMIKPIMANVIKPILKDWG